MRFREPPPVSSPTRPRTSASLGWRLTQTAFLVVAVAWVLSLLLVVLWERLDTRKPAHAIVVMGAAQYVGHPSPVLRARVDHAIELWRRGLAPRMIFTGGFGDRVRTGEAAVPERYAIEHGVPARAILIENTGRSTSASLRQVSF